MPVTKDGYRDYLRSRELLAKTIDSYCSGLNHLAQHCGQDLWTLTDLEQLDTLQADYSLQGQYSEAGAYSNGSARNALRYWIEYVVSETSADKKKPAAFLLTWNPEHYQDGGNAGVRAGRIERWSCYSTKPVIGDRVYLIRLGVDPRGIVARGTVTEGSFKAEDWRDATKTRSYIRFQAEETRPDCVSGLLPIVLLEQLSKGKFKWSAQSSGIAIPPELAESLDKVWEIGRDVHSLAQCAHWYQAQHEWSNSSWRQKYLARIASIEAIQTNQQPLDNSTLDWLWRDGANGVCTVSPGQLSNTVYEKNIDMLRELGDLILQDPGHETYQQVFARWEQAKAAGSVPKIYTAVIHRVFAAAAPALYTTLVNVQDCRALLSRFTSDFQLTTADSSNWLELNHTINLALRQAGLPDSSPIDNNILVWMLYAAFFNPRTEVSNSESNLPTTTDPTETVESDMTNSIPLNQILFGPPGTGKTYNTINRALRILEPDLLNRSNVTRSELKDAFERYVDLGQIAFVTFHQSYSYEDFVEGLRAVTRPDGALEYQVVPGVFAQLCEQARRWTDQPQSPFDLAIDELARRASKAEGNWLPMQTVNGSRFQARYAPEKGTFSIDQENRKNDRTYDSANLKHVKSLYITGISSGYSESYVRGILKYLKLNCNLPEYDNSTTTEIEKPVVLIIDEINRGNISRIFGELITLIEPSKRTGESEALTTTLPYSKKPFSVPNNLYIIGTMNTADRSLAGLDIALRRRFVFEEMAPQYKELNKITIDGINIGELLEKMNQRIEILLDRDHCLGHAYFMQLKDKQPITKLAPIFKNQILPLLQEYFFEDWERIAWVLNDHRKTEPATQFLHQPKQDIKTLLGVANIGGQRQRWQLNEQAFNNPAAYQLIIEGDKGSQEGE